MLEKKGSISMVASLTFIKKFIKSNKQKKNDDNSSHISPCATISIAANDSQENELITPIPSPTKSDGMKNILKKIMTRAMKLLLA